MIATRLAAASVSAAFARATGSAAGGVGNLDCASQRHLDIMIELGFLQAGVIAHVDRPLARAHHDRIGAGECSGHAVDGGRLVIPLNEIANRFALDVGRVNPVDKRPALGFGQRSGGAHDKHRRAVEIGVVDAHRRVQQADQVMDDGDHRFALGAGIAMGDLHGDLFMLAGEHRRIVLAVIDQRVMQAAVARAGIERDVLEIIFFYHVDDHVGLPAFLGLFDC